MNHRALKYVFILLGILYFILPFDIIPDIMHLVGRFDDLIVLGYLYWQYKKLGKQLAPREGKSSSTERGGNSRDKGQSNSRKASAAAENDFDSYQVLGVKRGANKAEIHAAYRTLISRYHPDKVNHLGDEFKDLAHNKMIQIQDAYEDLLKRV